MKTFSRKREPDGHTLNMEQLLEYALIAEVPSAFLERLIRNQHHWDEEFVRLLNDFAYEFRPDLAIWEAHVTASGHLRLERTAPSVNDLPELLN